MIKKTFAKPQIGKKHGLIDRLSFLFFGEVGRFRLNRRRDQEIILFRDYSQTYVTTDTSASASLSIEELYRSK